MADYKDEITKVIRKYGKCVRMYASKKEPGLYTAICPGCRKEIFVPGSDLDKVQYTITKRGTCTIFHTDCFEKVWDSKIV